MTYYTINETANILKFSPITIRSYIKQGKLGASRFGSRIRVSENDLLAFAKPVKKEND